MIFAELDYPQHYQELHVALQTLLSANFASVQSGLQGDSWFWVFEGEEKVAVDSFTSMKHQVKSQTAGPLVQKVIDVLSSKYRVSVYETPIREGQED